MSSLSAASPIDLAHGHRQALMGHCYRMLGSVVEAEDAAQETLMRAWRAQSQFDHRASLLTWLYRIATRVCLDTLSERQRRVRTFDAFPLGTPDDPLEQRPRSHWLEPVPDAHVFPETASPQERLVLQQHTRLAFVAALQYLPPRQRAVLLMMEVLDFSALEVAEALEMTVAAVNSALQRARATLAARREANDETGPISIEQQHLVQRFMDAFQRYDLDALSTLLTSDAVLSMPPYTLWLQGRADIVCWMGGRGIGCKGSILVPTSACGMPAMAQYRDGGAQPWALHVLYLRGEAVAGMTAFLDVETLFPRFGLPMQLLDSKISI